MEGKFHHTLVFPPQLTVEKTKKKKQHKKYQAASILCDICKVWGNTDASTLPIYSFSICTKKARLPGALLQQTKVLTADELKVTNNI